MICYIRKTSNHKTMIVTGTGEVLQSENVSGIDGVSGSCELLGRISFVDFAPVLSLDG